MNLAVVILNWNQSDATVHCAADLAAWRHVRPTVWVVDNGSQPALASVRLPAEPAIRLLRSEANLGFAGGNNLALAAILTTKTDAVLLLNTDAVLPERDALRLAEVLAADSRIGAAGPCLLEMAPAGQPRPTLGGRDIGRYLKTRLDRRPPGNTPVFDVDYVPGTAALLRCDMLRAVGLFDEDFFFSGEIADLCRRARQAGYRCVTVADASARHTPDAASPLRETLYAYYTLRNRFLYVRKHGGTRRTSQSARWTALGLTMIALALARGRTAKARALAWALRDGLRGRFGNRHDRFGL
jgi:hypothetical protein